MATKENLHEAMSKNMHGATKVSQNAIEGVVEKRDAVQNMINGAMKKDIRKEQNDSEVKSEKLRYVHADDIYE